MLILQITVLGFVWSLRRDFHREITDLRERMARIEGLFEGFTGRQPGGVAL